MSLPRSLGTTPYIFTNIRPLLRAEKRDLRALAEIMVINTHFSPEEGMKLIMFIRHVTDAEVFERSLFYQFLQDMFKITDDIVTDKVFRHFDQNRDGLIDLQEFVRGMSVFLRGDEEERSRWAFGVYDLNDDQTISRDELFTLLRCNMAMIDEYDSNENIKQTMELVEMTHRKLDTDKDGLISKDDFCAAVRKDPLLLQSLGKCLARLECVLAFMGVLNQFNVVIEDASGGAESAASRSQQLVEAACSLVGGK
ncbi:calaxin-like [Sycon ciliatum]|uniref:calaxin-like n=1 Tax=Sycon ciliatum TaxID=27933 RepID=UPI0020AAB059|eukprot:scpid78724/ scgid18711/ EF-hand calcium-binding domain-containing protein 1